jgi:hypothetical protein
MRRFFVKLAAFIAVNAAGAALFLCVVDSRLHFNQWETDSILLATPTNTELSLLLMGTSRTRILTRVKCNYDCFAREFGSVFNIAIPFGGGIVPEKIYLDNFYRQGNRAGTILYFIDPFTLFSDEPNRQHRLVYYEPLRPWFLTQLALNEFPMSRILIYVQSKFTTRWCTQTPGDVPRDPHTVQGPLDPEMIRKRVDSLYYDGLSEEWFTKYAGTLREIMQLARDHKSRLVLAFPPTLLGSQPGELRLLQELTKLRMEYDFEFHDFTEKIKDPSLYSDYDHLNSRGVERFVQEYHKPILKQDSSPSIPGDTQNASYRSGPTSRPR